MSNLRMMAFNELDNAALTSEPIANNITTLPVDNVKNGSHSRVFRTTAVDTNGVTIKGNLTQANYFSGLVLYRHNLKALDKMQLTIYSGANQAGNLVYDSGLIEALDVKNIADIDWGVEPLGASVFNDEEWMVAYSVHWFNPVAGQSFEIKIISENNAAGYIDIGRIFLGRSISPVVNYNYGYEANWIDPSKQQRTAGTTIFVHVKPKYRRIALTLAWLTELDRSLFFDVLRRVGNSREIFISLAPGSMGRFERDVSMACYIRSHSSISHPNYNRYSLKMTLEES